MAMLARVLVTELFKLKRTLALWMVLIAPMVVVMLNFLVGMFGPGTPLAQSIRGPWGQITNNTVNIWTLLMMPMFLTLETSLLAGLEHTDKNWKSLLALPAPRWTFYAGKLVVTIMLLWTAHAVLMGGTVLSATILKAARPALGFGAMPLSLLSRPLAKISVAALFALTIQHWVSLRWQSFTAALGFGMCAMVVSLVAVRSATYGPWYPWSMPLVSVLVLNSRGTHVIPAAIAGSVVAALFGCWEFSRREISS